MSENIEILAPAGSFESLEAGLRCGANAVYVGGKYFSARGNAVNFTDDELKNAVNLSHLYGAKIYIAVNTIISDDETDLFCEYIKYTSSIGIDAYIVQDLGCTYLIKKCVPNAVIHASTQMTLHTLQGAEFAKSLGFSRIVPARELSMSEIKLLKSSGLEIEIFVHGALCMSVSGQCYMSAMIGSRSANRGVCGQACRLPFSACKNKDFCGLSLKDLSLLKHMDKIKECGINSLKIEGRMKRPEYTASAVTETKKALDGQKPDMDTLKSIFSRNGFTDGYFTGKRSDMFGTRVKEDVISAKDLLPQIREYYRKIPKIYKLSFKTIIKENQNISLSAYCNGLSKTIFGNLPEKALKHSIDLPFIEKQLSKLGDTVFEYEKCECDIDDGLMVSASVLNNMRREIVSEISKAIINKNTPVYQISDYIPEIEPKKLLNKNKPKLRFQCSNLNQAKQVEPFADMLIIPIEECEKVVNIGIDRKKICIEPPRFITNENEIINKLRNLLKSGINHILCVNPAYVKIGNDLKFIMHGGFGLNITNSFSCKTLAEYNLSDITLSFEMKLSQLKKINSPVPVGIVAYGNLPLMLTRNCPIKNEVSCAKCKKTITDRTGRVFPVKCHKDYIEILNADTLWLSEKDIEGFDFVIINTDNFNNLNNFKYFGQSEFKPSFSTKGLYHRGIFYDTENKKVK